MSTAGLFVNNARDLFGHPIDYRPRGPLSERWLWPPFSVLDTRAAAWIGRRREWDALGLKPELGRSAIPGGAGRGSCMAEGRQGQARATSGFDPVLAEILFKWFSAEGDQVVDPFAGGACRGIVAAVLGRDYWGAELRREQVDSNETQRDIASFPGRPPSWRCGDSREILDTALAADFILMCPPYHDLERYSDDPRDLSAMSWGEYEAAYRDIMGGAIGSLKNDRFAAIVVGNIRAADGLIRDLKGLTINAATQAGAGLYNEMVVVQRTGTAAMRASRQFSAGRKVVKVDQSVLIFVKGDWKTAAGRL